MCCAKDGAHHLRPHERGLDEARLDDVVAELVQHHLAPGVRVPVARTRSAQCQGEAVLAPRAGRGRGRTRSSLAGCRSRCRLDGGHAVSFPRAVLACMENPCRGREWQCGMAVWPSSSVAVVHNPNEVSEHLPESDRRHTRPIEPTPAQDGPPSSWPRSRGCRPDRVGRIRSLSGVLLIAIP